MSWEWFTIPDPVGEIELFLLPDFTPKLHSAPFSWLSRALGEAGCEQSCVAVCQGEQASDTGAALCWAQLCPGLHRDHRLEPPSPVCLSAGPSGAVPCSGLYLQQELTSPAAHPPLLFLHCPTCRAASLRPAASPAGSADTTLTRMSPGMAGRCPSRLPEPGAHPHPRSEPL